MMVGGRWGELLLYSARKATEKSNDKKVKLWKFGLEIRQFLIVKHNYDWSSDLPRRVAVSSPL